MTTKTLTTDEALALIDRIDASGSIVDARMLACEWDVPGHWNDNIDKAGWIAALREFANDPETVLTVGAV